MNDQDEIDAIRIGEAELEALVMAEGRVQQLLEGQTVRKVIVKAPTLVNIVV